MGNKSSTILRKISTPHNHHQGQSENDAVLEESRKQSQQHYNVSLIRLFEKLELTADGDNVHPGELSKATFENAFHGPLHIFGKLIYLQMVSSGALHRERITREQFVKAGKEILKMHGEKALVKYYFHLFASGKDHLTNEDAKQMFEISFALTLSLSKILHKEDERDERVFCAMVTSLFGIKTEVKLEEFSTWHRDSCPELFQHVHNWVYHILTGSSLPEELDNCRVPMLDAVTNANNSISMAVLWLLSIVLPPAYTKLKAQKKSSAEGPSASLAASVAANNFSSGAGAGEYSVTKDPMWTSLLLLRKMARLPQCESWKVLYNSENHGMSSNRFSHHVASYHAANVTFFNFEGKNQYCLALDRGWREGCGKFGGEDCRLIQLLPVYRVIQSGENMVKWVESSKSSSQGIFVGCDGKAEVLRIPKDFDTISHYGVSCQLYRVEVWGCGSDDALEAQRIQKKWEAGAVSREQGRKLRPYGESWDDTPDKQLLQWGGVNVGNHSYDR
ncbi:uncharacterized protein LOC101847581 [Aplysia californica]|uniref:Uncharacterized protein LOC101847581 n=1 Tax=Aplysia californica TaxID=6500 RepID=A0ABM0JMM0_APLCA|nr:uncharacterized protein LOC101847581 [Aplysia californica]